MPDVVFVILIILLFAAPIAGMLESDDSNLFAYVLCTLFVLGGIIMACLFPPFLFIVLLLWWLAS